MSNSCRWLSTNRSADIQGSRTLATPGLKTCGRLRIRSGRSLGAPATQQPGTDGGTANRHSVREGPLLRTQVTYRTRPVASTSDALPKCEIRLGVARKQQSRHRVSLAEDASVSVYLRGRHGGRLIPARAPVISARPSRMSSSRLQAATFGSSKSCKSSPRELSVSDNLRRCIYQ